MEGSIEPRAWAKVHSSSLKELKEAAMGFTVHQLALQFWLLCAFHVLLPKQQHKRNWNFVFKLFFKTKKSSAIKEGLQKPSSLFVGNFT